MCEPCLLALGDPAATPHPKAAWLKEESHLLPPRTRPPVPALSTAALTHMGHVGVEHQSTQTEHQQPHGLPTEPVTVVDLQAGGGGNSGHCYPLSAQPLQP